VGLWEQWTWAAMGLKLLPYQVVQAMLVSKEVIQSLIYDPNNAFWWDQVHMNLLRSKEYDDPSLLWLSKIRVAGGKMMVDLFVYVDNAQITAPSEEECCKVTRQAASMAKSLGV
jgi:hypothetical protein